MEVKILGLREPASVRRFLGLSMRLGPLLYFFWFNQFSVKDQKKVTPKKGSTMETRGNPIVICELVRKRKPKAVHCRGLNKFWAQKNIVTTRNHQNSIGNSSGPLYYCGIAPPKQSPDSAENASAPVRQPAMASPAWPARGWPGRVWARRNASGDLPPSETAKGRNMPWVMVRICRDPSINSERTMCGMIIYIMNMFFMF